MFAPSEPLNAFRVRGEWADWLATFPWTHFGTYTFGEPRQTVRAAVGCLKAHHRRLGWDDVEARAFAVVEGGEGVRLHLHTLSLLRWVGARADLAAHAMVSEPLHRAAHRRWFESYGRCRVSPLQGDSTGAAFYVAKYLLKTAEPRWFFLPNRGWEGLIPE